MEHSNLAFKNRPIFEKKNPKVYKYWYSQYKLVSKHDCAHHGDLSNEPAQLEGASAAMLRVQLRQVTVTVFVLKEKSHDI